MSAYEPGTVARLVQRRRPDAAPSSQSSQTYERAIWDAANECWVSGTHGQVYDSAVWEIEVHPLVVLDLDGIAVDLDKLANIIETAALGTFLDDSPQAAALNQIAAQVRDQTRPPPIPEPTGFDAAVTARLLNSETRTRWVRTFTNPAIGSRPWTDGNHLANWDDLVDPVPVRDGIEDGAR